MCTLVAAVRLWPSSPLVVAANRDEMLDRRATPPLLWPGAPRVVAPRDEQAGGSWLGLNEHGLFVGVTNRSIARRDPSRRSRGALVMEALRARSAGALHEDLSRLDPREFNAFHLLYADRASAHLTWSDGEAIHRLDLEPGVHVITERSFGSGDGARQALIHRLWEQTARAGAEPRLEDLRALLVRHEEDPLASTCVHMDAFGYGTRSSFLLRLGDTWEGARALWAEGKPCVTEFAGMDEILRALAPR